MGKKQPVPVEAVVSVVTSAEPLEVTQPYILVEGVDGWAPTKLAVERATVERSVVVGGQTYEVCGDVVWRRLVYRAVRS